MNNVNDYKSSSFLPFVTMFFFSWGERLCFILLLRYPLCARDCRGDHPLGTECGSARLLDEAVATAPSAHGGNGARRERGGGG